MRLAKPHLDIGLFTNARDAQLSFWQETIGLEFDHLGKLGGGVHQHRHHVNGSILKVNHVRDPLAESPRSGVVGLRIARQGLSGVERFEDPDGNAVALVPPGEDGVIGIGIDLVVNDLDASTRFYTHAMGYEHVGPGVVRAGDTRLFLHPASQPVPRPEYRAPGFRYTTVQIFDCDQAHAYILARGGEEGRAPGTIGTTTRYSFVRDPDGNWIEVSHRFELTGDEPR